MRKPYRTTDPTGQASSSNGATAAHSLPPMVSDQRVMAIRTSESLDALADVLGAVLSLVPAMSTPSELRKTCEALAKKLHKDVARARAEGVADRLGASQWSGRA
jgi:hypothetical protein